MTDDDDGSIGSIDTDAFDRTIKEAQRSEPPLSGERMLYDVLEEASDDNHMMSMEDWASWGKEANNILELWGKLGDKISFEQKRFEADAFLRRHGWASIDEPIFPWQKRPARS